MMKKSKSTAMTAAIVAIAMAITTFTGCSAAGSMGSESSATNASQSATDGDISAADASNIGDSNAEASTGDSAADGGDSNMTTMSAEDFEKLTLADCYKLDGNNNMLVTQRFSADPGVMVYDDTVYIYSTNDTLELDLHNKAKTNTYSKITTLNCFSSKDLVNWTDEGVIKAAGKNGAAKWAHNSWAPAAAHKTIDGKEKFFLYFADNGSGIGVLTSDSPTGPWTDPLGEQIIKHTTENCEDVVWLFDPAVFVDEETGDAYLAFGGGIPEGKEAAPKTTRIVKLADDMIHIDGTPKMIDCPYTFEDSGINKIGDHWYYSYCQNFSTGDSGYNAGTIGYMMADDPLGEFEYKGEILENPGKYFGVGGNNHHSLFEFKGQTYIAYHTRTLESAQLGEDLGYRCTHIDPVKIATDGTIEKVTPSLAGVKQLSKFDPYQQNLAATIYRQGGLDTREAKKDEKISGNCVLTDIEAGDFFGVSQADFSKGLSTITVYAKAKEATAVDVRIGSEHGTSIGQIQIAASDDFAANVGSFEGLDGVHDLYFVFGGECEVDSWQAAEGTVLAVKEKADNTNNKNVGVQESAPALKDALSAQFGEDAITGLAITSNEISDKNLMALVEKHCNAVTFGNELKPDCLFGYCQGNPETEEVELNGEKLVVPKLHFETPEKMLDVILAWDQEHPDQQIKVRGHVLVWHSQTPEWFFHEDYDVKKDLVSKDEMTKRQEWYIKSVLTHFVGEDSKYKDIFYGWDVVNEAVSDATGTYRNDTENSMWWKVYQSNEFIINAFRFANEAAPESLDLYYNDYNEFLPAKSEGILQLLKDVKNAKGTRISGMGLQGHYHTNAGDPSAAQFTECCRKYAQVVDKLMITEFDMAVSDKYDGTDETRDTEYKLEAVRYGEIYDAAKELKKEGINFCGITWWGVIDPNSWLQFRNTVGGASDGKRKQVPLLFDGNYHIKPCFWTFVNGVDQGR